MIRGIEVRQLKLDELSLALIQELVANGIKDYVDSAAGQAVKHLVSVAGGPVQYASATDRLEVEDWDFVATTSIADAGTETLPAGGLLLADLTVDVPNDRFTLAANAVLNINWAPTDLLSHLESLFTGTALGIITVSEDTSVPGFHTTRISWDNDFPAYLTLALRDDPDPMLGSTLVSPHTETAEDLVYASFELKVAPAGTALTLFSGGPIDAASLAVDLGDVTWSVEGPTSISVTVPLDLVATVVTPLEFELASNVFADPSTPTQPELDAVVLVPKLAPHVFMIV